MELAVDLDSRALDGRGTRERPELVAVAGEQGDVLVVAGRRLRWAASELVEAPRELLLLEPDCRFAPLDRSALQLDGSKLTPPSLDCGLSLGNERFTAIKLGRACGELGLAEIELGRAVTQDLLDARVKLVRARFALLELVDGCAELDRPLLELAAALGDQLGHGVLTVRRGKEGAEAASHAVVRHRSSRPLFPFWVAFRLTVHRRRRIGVGRADDLSSAVEFEWAAGALMRFGARHSPPPQRARQCSPLGGG
jgi:hypothetical protein